MKLVECVPNFSEGRNKDIINRIADSVKGTENVSLLDVDPGYDTNRTVFTFVGSPDDVVKAAFNAIKTGSELIDMRKHSGAHPRMGACDVCPFIPVSETSMEECVELARKLGKRVSDELGIPVYLYEFAATKAERRNLANVRSGEYEGLAEKIVTPGWEPDFGKPAVTESVRKSGATVIGAREFLIAYNVNVNSKDKTLATTIAKKIREKGDTKKRPDGTEETLPGLLQECKAIGWYVDDYKRAQISINLTNFHVTNMHHAYEAAKSEGDKIGVSVTGSEIVGLVPLQAIIESGLYYIERQGGSRAVPEREIIDIAAYSLGLSDVVKFNPDEKIIEYKMGLKGKKSLVNLSVTDFTHELASKSPAPGGGAISALNGSIAASLVAMVGNLTFKKKAYKDAWGEAEKIATEAHRLKDQYLAMIDKDTDAFNRFMEATKSDDEALLHEATKYASEVPLETALMALSVLPLLERIVAIGNKNAISDAGVAVLNLRSSFLAAKYNVAINLKEFGDNEFRQSTMSRLLEAEKKVLPGCDKLTSEIEKLLGL